MKKQEVKLESLLTVISPQQFVRIMDEAQPQDLTIFKGTAVKAFREYAGKGITIKHISPEVEKETDQAMPRYVMDIYVYMN